MCLFWTQRKIFWRMRETAVFFSPTIEVNGVPKQPDYKLSSEYLLLCSEQTHSYRFGSTWGWVNDDRIFIFGWTVSLSSSSNHRDFSPFVSLRWRCAFVPRQLLRQEMAPNIYEWVNQQIHSETRGPFFVPRLIHLRWFERCQIF